MTSYLLFSFLAHAEDPAPAEPTANATPEEIEAAEQSAGVKLAAGLHDRAEALAQMLKDQKTVLDAAGKGCSPPFDWAVPTIESYTPPAVFPGLPACLTTCDCPKAPPVEETSADAPTAKE